MAKLVHLPPGNPISSMRILQVIPFFSPQMGGSAEVVYQLSKHLSRRGHEVTVVTTNYPPRAPRYSEEEICVIEIPNCYAGTGFYLSPGLVSWASQNVRKFDIIHMHTFRTFQNVIIGNFASRYNIPYILSAHGTLPVIVQRKFAKRLFDIFLGKKLLSSSKYLIAQSLLEANHFRQIGIPDYKIRIIYNGLDPADFTELPPRGSFKMQSQIINPDERIILFLGRLHKIKGIETLIFAFKNVLRSIKNLQLVIAGPDEGELSKLISLTLKLQIQYHVKFIGPVYDRDKLSLFIDSDVLVYPSLYESFGLVPFEALLCGIPIIVSKNIGAAQIISEFDAGYVVDYGDVYGLQKALEDIFLIPNKTQQMVNQGKKLIAQKLSWVQNIVDIENIYYDVIQ
jgi:glycosyltransferase involved in cell wall biosynthesis